MRLISFGTPDGPRAGLVDSGRVLDLGALDAGLPATLDEIVACWEQHRPTLRELGPPAAWPVAAARPLATVDVLLPLHPRRLLGTGINYGDHVAEMHARPPQAPSAFLKLPGSVIGPGRPVRLCRDDRHVDYEGEIAVVIGRPVRDADPATAVDAVAGLMLANDLSHRDVPTAHIVLAKGGPGFCPLGPALVTTDELVLGGITFTVEVNGEPRQHGHTAAMIHDFGSIVASYSRAVPLLPGDMILTGTPSGVGVGRRPPVFLRDGDQVVITSPQLGTLRTPVVQRRN